MQSAWSSDYDDWGRSPGTHAGQASPITPRNTTSMSPTSPLGSLTIEPLPLIVAGVAGVAVWGAAATIVVVMPLAASALMVVMTGLLSRS
jgi:hypothetical protein